MTFNNHDGQKVIIQIKDLSNRHFYAAEIYFQSQNGCYVLDNTLVESTAGRILFNRIDVLNPYFKQWFEQKGVFVTWDLMSNKVSLTCHNRIVITKEELAIIANQPTPLELDIFDFIPQTYLPHFTTPPALLPTAVTQTSAPTTTTTTSHLRLSSSAPA